MTPSRPTRTQAKGARTARNDERILAAIVDVLGDRGFGHVSASSVARRADTSIRPVRDRYAGRSQMVEGAWRERLDEVLHDALAPLAHAATDPSDLEQALTSCLVPHPLARTAAEASLLAPFEPMLREAVQRGVAAHVTRWTDPTTDRTAAARRAYLLGLGLGALLIARRPQATSVDAARHAARLATALTTDRQPVPLPPLPPPFHTGEGGSPVIDTGDQLLDAVLTATLRGVAAHGFDGVTVQRIARAAGVSEGFVFSRYPSKIALFVDATTRQVPSDYRAWQQLVADTTAAHGPGIAEAVQLREFQRDTRAWARAIAYEQRRLGFHDARLREAEERQLHDFALAAEAEGRSPDEAQSWIHLEYALGTGMVALPLLAPAAWTLPYDVVTVPLLG